MLLNIFYSGRFYGDPEVLEKKKNKSKPIGEREVGAQLCLFPFQLRNLALIPSSHQPRCPQA